MGFAVIIAAASQTACPPRQSQKATSQMPSLATCSLWVRGPLGPINEPKKTTPSLKRKTCYDTMNMPASRPAIAHPVGTARKASFSLVAGLLTLGASFSRDSCEVERRGSLHIPGIFLQNFCFESGFGREEKILLMVFSSPGLRPSDQLEWNPLCNEVDLSSRPETSPLNTPNTCMRQVQTTAWVKRCLYGLEKFLRVSYKGFEQEASDLFSAIESSHKSAKMRQAHLKKGGWE
ncbi:hypothetical protein FH972_002673 [Carpinus fangiana]|uniref:Uncharacterized protein n=1 Tax=Carpinus fangiana TaxID=176857 RepID=A0A5N6QG38_9ROSI|nr:hypothetical protein FH972_002673 [Carpinus fangiana]